MTVDDRTSRLPRDTGNGTSAGDASVPAALRDQLTGDPWGASLGIEFLEIRRGYCRAALTLAPHMVNFHGTPHGGVIFSLADTVFGVACNSHGEMSVALSVTISYLAAAQPGSRLVAEAQQVKQGRRAGFYDIAVTADDGRVVAVAHCVAQRLGDRISGAGTPGTPGG